MRQQRCTTPAARLRRRVLASLGIVAFVAATVELAVGSVDIGIVDALATVASALGWSDYEPDSVTRAVVLGIRAPRIVTAMLVGAALATCGAALQGMFRNPLADPGLVGVSSGAALGAALVIVFGTEGTSVFALGTAALSTQIALPLAAFMGAVTATIVVHRLSVRHGRASVEGMLLAGIAINALVGAAIGLLSFVTDDARLRDLTLWMLGSLGGTSWLSVAAMLPWVLLTIVLLGARARGLDALLLGEAEAFHLGVDVDRLKRVIIVTAALGVGAAVAFVGPIGFVGLVTPHILRLAFGPSHRLLIPGGAILGGTILLLADALARTVVQPAELPIGIVTALVGAPLFLWLLLDRRLRSRA